MAYLAKYISRSSRLAKFYQRGYSTASPFVFSEEVSCAKSEGKPIVALESTIITHGMPYPQNLETAKQVENIIRERGAIPATIAILKGQLTIGLSEDQLSYLAQAKGVVKASRRDLAPIAAAKLDGATTVAGTIIAAQLADIPVFVTGGIGGVHRHGEDTLDVSADLNELGRSNTLVVCSGVKSILDIGRTLEYLETQGVCVCAFGDTSDFPAFYTARSGFTAPHRVADASGAARVLHAARELQLSSGTVVAVPIPQEYAMDEKIIEDAISGALKKAEKQGVSGKEVTPFILSAVVKATSGASLQANIALIKNNAKVGADIAVEFKKLKNVDNSRNAFNIGSSKGVGKCSSNSSRHFHTSCSRGTDDEPLFSADKNCDGDVLVIGGANVDRTYRLKEDGVQLDGSTHMCGTEQGAGGVARNMAEALYRLRGGRTKLLTAVGDDADGEYLANVAPGLLLDDCIVKNGRTPSYAAVMDVRGECLLGLGDMALHNHITVDLVKKYINVLEKAPLIVLDGNVPQSTINYVLDTCQRLQKPVFFEPTDRRKAPKIIQHQQISYASPNLSELRAMAQKNEASQGTHTKDNSEITEIIKLYSTVSKVIQFVIVTMGSKGVITMRRNRSHNIVTKFYPTEPIPKIENVSGAGDCFASGFIVGMLSGLQESQSIFLGFEAAKMALLCRNTVPPNLNNLMNTTCYKDAKYELVK